MEVIEALAFAFLLRDLLTDSFVVSTCSGYKVEPDITILQVLNNDIYGLFFSKLNLFNREGKNCQPSELQKEFLRRWMKEVSKWGGLNGFLAGSLGLFETPQKILAAAHHHGLALVWRAHRVHQWFSHCPFHLCPVLILCGLQSMNWSVSA
jgi:hypothetical protein